MTYTIIINTKHNPELVFKHIKSFYAEPGRIKLFRASWVTVENVTGIILHEESKMSRLSDDEKRYLTDQISMLKNENERLTKHYEDVSVENLWMRREIERVGYALYTGTITGYVGTEEDLQTIGQNVEGVCETNERLMNVEAEGEQLGNALAGAQVFAIELKAENEALREAGKGMLALADSYRENGLPIIFPYADEIVAMKDALLTGESDTTSLP